MKVYLNWLLYCFLQLSDNSEHSAYYRLVEVFAYGVYDNYLEAKPPLPQLTQPMLAKLRHLTIVTMASTNKSLELDNLETKLGLSSRRELEDLIIEAIYAGKKNYICMVHWR